MFGHWEILIVLVIILVVFGAGKLPRVMGDLGKGISSFKKGMSSEDEVTEKPEAPKKAVAKKSVAGKKATMAKKSTAKKSTTKKVKTATKKAS